MAAGLLIIALIAIIAASCLDKPPLREDGAIVVRDRSMT